MTRAIVVRMRRRAPDEHVDSYRRRLHQTDGHAIRDQLADWANTVTGDLTDAWPELPEGIEDRAADIWEPLLAIADAAGGHWPDRARVSAVTLVSDARAKAGGFGVQLLADLRTIFTENNTDKLSTETILHCLHDMEESPWSTLRQGQLDARGLSRRLSKYEIGRKQIRIGEWTGKGYDRADLADTWARYLPPEQDSSTPPLSRASETTETRKRCAHCSTNLSPYRTEQGYTTCLDHDRLETRETA